ncbi:MAG: hemerythrin domain-containing protein [Candidatus Xenobia bacterium]
MRRSQHLVELQHAALHFLFDKLRLILAAPKTDRDLATLLEDVLRELRTTMQVHFATEEQGDHHSSFLPHSAHLVPSLRMLEQQHEMLRQTLQELLQAVTQGETREALVAELSALIQKLRLHEGAEERLWKARMMSD